MGRQPCCEKVGLKKGPWALDEDRKLAGFMARHGVYSAWREVPKLAGLLRCGKSCRLRWTNYLRPDLKRGLLSDAEERLVIDLHAAIGNRWSRIAAQLPGRTDNEIKNYWNTRIKKKLKHMGIDPATHKPLHESTNKLSTSKPNSTLDSKSCSKNQLIRGENVAGGIEEPSDSNVTSILSKRERLELESREAHLRVQKMKEALLAFNSSFIHDHNSSPSLINSPTSVLSALAPRTHSSLDLTKPSLHTKASELRANKNSHHLANTPCFEEFSNVMRTHNLGPPFFPFYQATEEPSPHNNMGEVNYSANHGAFGTNFEKSYSTNLFICNDCQFFPINEHKESKKSAHNDQKSHMGVLETSPSVHHHSSCATTPSQEMAMCNWIKDTLGVQDNRTSLVVTPCQWPSLGSSIKASSTLPSSTCSDASSWNLMMQQLLIEENDTLHSSTNMIDTTTHNYGNSNFVSFELQRLAILLDEI